MSHVDITVSPQGTGTFLLDGEDISSAIRGFDISAHVGDPTEIQLDLAIWSHLRFAGDVYISHGAHELLVRLGWTPPPDSTSTQLPGAAAGSSRVEGQPPSP